MGGDGRLRSHARAVALPDASPPHPAHLGAEAGGVSYRRDSPRRRRNETANPSPSRPVPIHKSEMNGFS